MKKYLKIIALILCFTLTFEIFSVSAETLSMDGEQEISVSARSDETDSDDIYIIGEDTSKREENIKHFVMSDHSYKAVIYSEPVHYKSGKQWLDIDNTLTLKETEDNGDFYENKGQLLKTLFSKDLSDDNLVNITDGDYSISWGYKTGFLKKLFKKAKVINGDFSNTLFSKYSKKLTSEVKYENIGDGVSLDYKVTGAGIKENIIIDDKSDEYNYSFTFKLKNLKAQLNGHGGIDLVSTKTKKAVFEIPVPYMTDNNGRCSYDVSYKLDENLGGKYTLTVQADKEWINSEETEFPVTIDPIIKKKTNSNAIKSTFIVSNRSTQNFYGYPNIDVGVDLGSSSNPYLQMRSLLQVTLPQLRGGDVITGASIGLQERSCYIYTDGKTSMPVYAHKITEDWNPETVTWATAPKYNGTITDYAGVSPLSSQTDVVVKWLDITKLAKEWYYKPAENRGVMLVSPAEDSSKSGLAGHAVFTSGYGFENDYPCVSIDYRNNKGLEEYWDSTEISADTAGTAYVNNYTGNLVFASNVISSSNQRFPLSADLVYNSCDNTSSSAVSDGWKISLERKVVSSSALGFTGATAQAYPFVYIDEDGTEHYLKSSGEQNAYEDEDGLGITYYPASGNNKAYLEDLSNNKIEFNSNGYMISCTDSNNNKITVEYNADGKISKATDGSGRDFVFSYANSKLSKITEKISDDGTDNKVTEFGYTDGNLTEIEYPNGTVSTYGYSTDRNGNDILSSAEANDGAKLIFSYSSSYLNDISTVKEYGGTSEKEHYYFNRSKHNTTYIRTSGGDMIYGDSDDVITTYQFDNYGRTTSSQTQTADNLDYESGVANYLSTSNSRQANRVKSTASSGGNVENLITNSNAESLTGWTKFSANCTATLGLDSSVKYMGENSFKVNMTDAAAQSGRAYFYQDVTSVEGGKTYTFSAYFRITGGTKVNDGNYGAHLAMYTTCSDSANNTSANSAYIYNTNLTTMENGWRRLSVTTEMPSDVTKVRCCVILRNIKGTVNYDCMQLEESETPNSYNAIENASFEKISSNVPTSWTTSSLSASETNQTSQKRHGSHAVRMNGVYDKNREIKQTIAIGGTQKDTYTLSGWANANAVTVSQPGRKFKLDSIVTYKKGTETKTEYKTPAVFNETISGWQYASQIIDISSTKYPDWTPVSITVLLRYTWQVNTAYFDLIQLSKNTSEDYSYDSNGMTTSVDEGDNTTTSMTYSGADLTSQTDPMGNTENYSYDPNHNITEEATAAGRKTIYTNNSFGGQTSSVVQNSDGTAKIKTETEYNTAQNGVNDGSYITKETDQNGNSINYSYNLKRGLLTSVADTDGNLTEYTYQSKTDDRIKKVKTSNQSVSYTYSGNRISTITYGGDTYSFEYDNLGNVTNTRVNGKLITNNVYNNNGTLNATVYSGNMDTVGYTYDEFGNLDTVTKVNQPAYGYKYNNDGKTASVIDYTNNRRDNYEYNAAGQLVRKLTVANSNNRYMYSSDYRYNADNSVNKFTVEAGGRTTQNLYYYDAVSGRPETVNYAKNNLLSRYAFNGSRYTDYDYDGLDRLTAKTTVLQTPIYYNYSYYSSNRNSEGESVYTTSDIKEEIVDNISYLYYYDSKGNITEIKRGSRTNADTNDSATSGYTDYLSYEYDSLNQLTRENNKQTNETTVYSYDNAGNITSKKIYAYTVSAEIETELKDTVNYGYGTSGGAGWSKLLTSYNGESIVYNTAGNPTTYRGANLDWYGRELTSYTKGNNTLSFTYDADGLRATKKVNGVTSQYKYDDEHVTYERRGTTDIYYWYDGNGHLFAIRCYFADGTNVLYYATTNSRGDVLGLYTGGGDQQVWYEYDAWGNTTITDTSTSGIGSINPIRYRGYYYDNETDLYYLQSRYYDPETGRFLNADALEFLGEGDEITGYNLFAYCLNNPVMMADSTGDVAGVATLTYVAATNWWNPVGYIAIGCVIGVAVGSGILYVQSRKKPNKEKKRAAKKRANPYARPGEKKQNRERRNKARLGDDWVPRSNPKPQKKHTPGRGHRKYKN